jgi:hypothetical protein
MGTATQIKMVDTKDNLTNSLAFYSEIDFFIRPLLLSNPEFVSKRIDDRTFEKFVRDVKTLRTVYTDAKIAAIMKTNPGNFSSRVNGTKRPGQDFINLFYQVWGKKLQNLEAVEENDAKKNNASRSDGPKQTFPGSSIYQDERLQRLEEGISRLDTAIIVLMERLVIAHQKLIDAHLSILSQQFKMAGEESE